MPQECSEYVKMASADWDGDGHTHSFLTLKEIRDYQSKGPEIFYRGLISPEQQVEFETNGTKPTSWCQGTNQEGYDWREWSEPNDVLVPLIKKMEKRAIELMQHGYGDYKTENDDNIRIVFWFDN